MNFKIWLENTVFGKEVNSPEEFDQATLDYYKSLGYTDEQIEKIMKMVNSDIYSDPSLDKKRWTPYDSPHYGKVWHLFEEALEKYIKQLLPKKQWYQSSYSPKEIFEAALDYKKAFLWILKEDQLISKYYKSLHTPEVTSNDLDKFVEYLFKIKILPNYHKKVTRSGSDGRNVPQHLRIGVYERDIPSNLQTARSFLTN